MNEIICFGISDLQSEALQHQQNNLIVKFLFTHDYPSVVIPHVFENEKTIVDLVRTCNKVWSIRQNLNLKLAAIPDTTEAHFDFDNIYQYFLDPKKQKQPLLDSVNFFTRVKKIYHSFDIAFQNDECIYKPIFDVHFDFPVKFGSSSEACSVQWNSFMKFIVYLNVYSTQALLVSANHFKFKPFLKTLTKYRCILEYRFNLVSKNYEKFTVPLIDFNQELSSIRVDTMYTKFFAG